jgi:quercetin dioxygenase-like cupin family protein
MHIESGLLSIPPITNDKGSCLSPSSLTYDLPRLIGIMKREPKWEKGELNTMILLKSPQKKIMLTIMHKGTEVVSYQSGKSLTLQIAEGKLNLHLKSESVILKGGELFTILENVKYSFESLEDTVFLLTHLS